MGSALIARALADGMRVIAVARNDASGERTRSAVQNAAEGFGLSPLLPMTDRLCVLDADLQESEATIPARLLADVAVVWHTAAEMNYSSDKLLASYQTNVINTLRLYRHVAAHAPLCRRFVHVSTAYVAGMAGGVVPETLEVGQVFDNTYQITKSMAEHALAYASQSTGLPVTLFRPTIIVGHRSSGWARRSGFGYYMFVEAVASAARAGMSHLRLNLDPYARPDLVTIDALIHDAMHLSLLPSRQMVEIYHASGGLGISVAELMCAVGEVCGIEIACGKPESKLDKRIDIAVASNIQFACTSWQFDRSRLDAALGEAAKAAIHAPVGLGELKRMAEWYLRPEQPSTTQSSAGLTMNRPAFMEAG
jgi:nucleoside-diphosphate-sugar epimerase